VVRVPSRCLSHIKQRPLTVRRFIAHRLTDISEILSGMLHIGGASDLGGFFLLQHETPVESTGATDGAASFR
jgi:hypothetical protein